MILSLVLKNGSTYGDLSKIGKSTSTPFTFSGENFSLEKNFADKSNNDGSEEIGERRIESTRIRIKGDWVAETDEEFLSKINPLLKAFEGTAFIRDSETLRRLKVVPTTIEVDHERGSYRRSGTYSMGFERLDPSWFSETLATDQIIVPGGGATYDTITVGTAETQSIITIIPEGSAEVLDLEIVNLTPGTTGIPDDITGVLALDNGDSPIVAAGLGMVIDNENAKCFSSPVEQDPDVTYWNKLNVRTGLDQWIAEIGSDITSTYSAAAGGHFGNALQVPDGQQEVLIPVKTLTDNTKFSFGFWYTPSFNAGVLPPGQPSVVLFSLGQPTFPNNEFIWFCPYTSSSFRPAGLEAFATYAGYNDPVPANSFGFVSGTPLYMSFSFEQVGTSDIYRIKGYKNNSLLFTVTANMAEEGIISATDLHFGGQGNGTEASNPEGGPAGLIENITVWEGLIKSDFSYYLSQQPITGNVTGEEIEDLRKYIKPGTSFFKEEPGDNGLSITCDTDIIANFEWLDRALV